MITRDQVQRVKESLAAGVPTRIIAANMRMSHHSVGRISRNEIVGVDPAYLARLARTRREREQKRQARAAAQLARAARHRPRADDIDPIEYARAHMRALQCRGDPRAHA